MHYDVFNGDADGICALLQLRLAEPAGLASAVTGIKRDIALLDRSSARARVITVTVLDISMAKNSRRAQPVARIDGCVG